ncbi:MAG TPA: FtsX-like permease family protein [Vicinamibacterales bacterium]|nr:FtsX-like permease family protein [Vicinamibacterales bacterium]
MTVGTIARRSLAHYSRTHAAVALGVAAAVAVLAGSLLVGASVRDSLQAIAAGRLGAATVVIANAQPFTESLAGRLGRPASTDVAPMLALSGVVSHESSSRRAGSVSVYGVDDRFFQLHHVTQPAPAGTEAWLSEDLAADLGARAGDPVTIRMPRPADIPLDSLHGRRDQAGRTIRLTVGGVLNRASMGEFSLAPGQGPVRSVFVSLGRLQRDLSLDERVNTVLAGGTSTAAATITALNSNVSISDLGLLVSALDDPPVTLIESKSGLIPDGIVEPLMAIGSRAGRTATPVLTWLANRLTAPNGSVPYSLVTAIGPDAAGDARVAALLATQGDLPPIVLNEWTQRDLRAGAGATIDLEYFKWLDSGQLATAHATFRVAGTIPMTGLAVDRRLAPDYPGITTASDFGEWDPPFPIDLGLVRPQDEAYWKQYRTSPKALIPLDAGQSLWRSQHGQVTSIRIRTPAPAAAADITAEIVGAVDPSRAGFTVVDVRRQATAAAAGSTDFGEYFSYFSAFLMVSALLLSALFFRLSIEQRLAQIGVLRATGFSLSDIRRLFLAEAAVIVGAGAVIGIALAIGWAALMMFALRTWWIGAVGTTQLQLHVNAVSLLIGAAGAGVAAFGAIAWTVRSLGRLTPRAQLSGSREPIAMGPPRRWLPAMFLAGAIGLSVLAALRLADPAGGFFVAGALVVSAGLAIFRLRMMRPRVSEARLTSIPALGRRNTSWRPGRSMVVAGLVAGAAFLLVSVDAFRKGASPSAALDSGTGGFAMLAESALPIVQDLHTREGRAAVGLDEAGGGALAGAQIVGLRLRPGDDASCLNLFQPRHPRIVGVPGSLVRERRFTFASTMSHEGNNPWTLIERPATDGAIPAIVDATSLEYVLHSAVGETITVDDDTTRPIRLRIVGALSDSVLQGEMLIAEPNFRSLFPDIAGFRFFLISIPDPTPARTSAAMTALERSLEPFGFDAEDTTARLAAFHRVENTYLSTFQALGGLGLLLGCVGVVAVVMRNVLERRRELALLGAAGFTGADLQRLIAVEHVTVIGAGLAIGLAAAAVAVGPIIISRGGGMPWHALAWIAPVAVGGLIAAVAATRALRRMPLVPSLRSE